jgi:hypothetical protein
MARRTRPKNVAYGISQALLNVSPFPVISERAPTTSDFAELGTIWVDRPNNDGYVLTSITSNQANWIGIGGGVGAFTEIGVNTAPGAAGTIRSAGSITSLSGGIAAQGAGGAITAATTITAGTGITATTGNIVATAGGLSAGTTVTAGGDITSVGGDIVAIAGDIEANTGSFRALAGNFIASVGSFSAPTSGTGLALNGGIIVTAGAGDPNGVVAGARGSLWLRTDPAGAASRVYVNTDGATTWTNLTAAA